MTEQVLALTAGMPERDVPAGADVLDGLGHALGVLVSGRLRVTAGDVLLAHLEVPGSFVGDLDALLGCGLTARVAAVERTRIRVIEDPTAFFRDHPELGWELARQFAGRLYRISAHVSATPVDPPRPGAVERPSSAWRAVRVADIGGSTAS